MTYLFVFAHPDDESVASAGTMRRLIEQGHTVVVVSVTDGGAGELDRHELLEEAGVYSVAELRRKEFAAVSHRIGVTDNRILGYKDGTITNKVVWGKLSDDIIDLIDELHPDVVVTFDHTGWYFHLDHVGVSIATTLAYQQSTHRPKALLLSQYRVDSGKWKYIFPERLPVTHRVDVTSYRELKQDCYNLHASQELNAPRKQLQEKQLYEDYQLVFESQHHGSILDPTIFVSV